MFSWEILFDGTNWQGRNRLKGCVGLIQFHSRSFRYRNKTGKFYISSYVREDIEMHNGFYRKIYFRWNYVNLEVRWFNVLFSLFFLQLWFSRCFTWILNCDATKVIHAGVEWRRVCLKGREIFYCLPDLN